MDWRQYEMQYPVEKEELYPRYDSRQSFYGKARELTYADGTVILQSYSTMVACIKDGQAIVRGSYSQTTTRHTKEFLKQHGFYADNLHQILKDYGEDD